MKDIQERVDALIERVMAKFPGQTEKSDVRYYYAVHQELAPLAREIERQRNELLAALEGLHKVCSLALSGKDGQQHTYFETRAGHFVEATQAMQQAESAIASMRGGAA